MKKVLSFVIILLSLNFVFGLSFDYSGKVEKVYDGDTIWVNKGNYDEKIRLLGIDTPELYHGQKIKNYKFYACANEAKSMAIKLLLNKYVKVYKDKFAKNKGKYGRKLRYIKVPLRYNKKLVYVDYGAIMIYLGRAKVYRWENFESKSLYYSLQNEAKKYKRGIWSKKCIQEDKEIKQKSKNITNKNSILNLNNLAYKKTKKILTYNDENLFKKKSVNNCGYTYHKIGCDIKGNISRKGVKIYHKPGWRYYKLTKITPNKGERWFCTEKEAIKCGWRASYVK